MKLGFLLLAGVGALVAAQPAQAVLLLVSITGDSEVSFEIDSQPTPDYADAGGMLFFNVPIEHAGDNGIADIGFFTNGFSLLSYVPSIPSVDASGPPMFTVTGSQYYMPTIVPGVYALTNDLFDLSYTVTIAAETTAVPEPASWALMIGGFALAGIALRARRAKAAIAFA